MEYKATISDLVEKIKRQELTSVELVKYYLKRIKNLNSKYNAFLFIKDEEKLLEEAYKADQEAKKKSNKRLLGIPYAIKDSFQAIGTITTAGDKYLENTYSEYDAVVVENLKTEGAILIGKTNMDSWGFGGSTENSAYGPTCNPYDPERIAGGSSGGSAAALALDMCTFAIGEDTGGSVRNPAAHCGIYGLKPTYGRISRYGCIAYASSLDTVGIFAKNLQDLRLIFDIISTFDDKDMTYESYTPERKRKNKFAYSIDLIPHEINQYIRNAYLETIERFKNKGLEGINIEFPFKDLLIPTYYITAMAEASTNLARYQGTRYGKLYQELEKNNFNFDKYKIKSWQDLFTIARTEGLTKEAKRRVIVGAFTLMEGYFDAYYLKSQQIRKLLYDKINTILEDVDFILMPVTPNIPKKINEKGSNPLESYLEDIYTVTANLVGMPAISFPAHKINNIPIGMQILGAKGSDELLISILELIC